MRSGISIVVSASDRARLEALVAASGSPQKHVWRARIVLLTDDGLGTVGIMAATEKSKTCVWRWQERFMAEGVHGDDTTGPVLAGTRTDFGRLWPYICDDRPFGGPAPHAALFRYLLDRRGEHPVGHLAGYRGHMPGASSPSWPTPPA